MRLPPATRLGRTGAALLLAAVLAGCSGEDPKALLQAGRDALAKQDPKTAVIHIKNALLRDPALPDARVLLGRALLAAQDPVGAALELNKALDAQAPKEQVLPLLARAMLLSGEYQKLTSVYSEVTLAEPKANAVLKSAVAAAWGAVGDRAKTERSIAAALASDPDYGPARVLNARLMAGRQEFDKALAEVDGVLAKDPKMAEAWVLKGDILTIGKKETANGVTAYEQAVVAEPAHVAGHLALINQAIRARDTAGAKLHADKMRAAVPQHPVSRFVDAQLALLDKNWDKARDLSAQMLRVAPNQPGVLMLAGTIEGQTGSLFAAESHFSKLLTIDPTSPYARRSLATVYLKLGQPGKALSVLKPALDANLGGTAVLALAGDAALRLGDADLSEQYYLAASKLDPNDSRLRTAIVITQMRRSDPATAFAELAQVASSTSETFADYAIVSARVKRSEYEAALQALQALDKKTPGSAEVAELRGRVLLKKGDIAAAREAFERAKTLDPKLFSAVANLAALDVLEKKPQQAEQRIKAAIDADARNHLAKLTMAALRSKAGGSLDEVRALHVDAIKTAPLDTGARLQYIAWLLEKRLHKDALAAAQEAAAAFPNDTTLLDSVGRAQMEAGDVEQAVGTFRKLAGGESNPAAGYLRLADVYRTTGKRTLAEASLRKAIELDPTLQQAHTALIANLIAAQRSKEALEHALKLQRTKPDQAYGYAAEASFHLAQKNPADAADAYRRGAAATKNSQLARWLIGLLEKQGRAAEVDRYALAWLAQNPLDAAFDYQYSATLIKRGQLEPAEARLRKIVKQFPDNSAALNNLAWVLAVRKQPDALQIAERAAARAPDSPEVLDTLALALSAQNEPAKALATQKRAVELHPNEPSMRLQLARLAIDAGDKTLAREELDRLQTMGQKFARQDEVGKLMKAL
jgi:cellulose synthase operon protein C